jgi:hypothetical protein
MPPTAREPSHYSRYGVGGLHYVETIDDFSEISEIFRESGMLVFVSNTQDLYTWTGNSWSLVNYVHQDLFDTNIEDIRDLLEWEEHE